MNPGRIPPRPPPIPRHDTPRELPPVHANGNGNGDDEPTTVTERPLADLPDRALLEDGVRGTELTRLRVDTAIRDIREVRDRVKFAEFHARAAHEEGRENAKRIGKLEEQGKEMLTILRATQTQAKTAAKTAALAKVDATTAKTQASEARTAIARTSHTEEQLVEVLVEERRDEIIARRERRALLVAGAKRLGLLVLPILTAAAGVIATLLAKGCP